MYFFARNLCKNHHKRGQDYLRLKQRLGNLTARGVVLKTGQSLYDLYKERTPLYERYAHVVIDETNLTVEQTIKAVMEALELEA